MPGGSFAGTALRLGSSASVGFEVRRATEGNREVLFAMVEARGTIWTNVISYYFGSSVGQARQTEPLAQTISRL